MPYREISFAQGHYYHIYNRGSGRQQIFREDKNYPFALQLIEKYSTNLKVAIIAYCLIPNHYHLLVRQDGQQSAGLLPQRVFNSYTKAFNKCYGRTGTLFEGRFKAIWVESERYLLHLCRYIHANPVLHGLVAQVEDWPYSNYHEWLGLRNSSPVDQDFVRAYFPTARDYQQFVLDYLEYREHLPKGIEPWLLE